jgi:hypothetical protein
MTSMSTLPPASVKPRNPVLKRYDDADFGIKHFSWPSAYSAFSK